MMADKNQESEPVVIEPSVLRMVCERACHGYEARHKRESFGFVFGTLARTGRLLVRRAVPYRGGTRTRTGVSFDDWDSVLRVLRRREQLARELGDLATALQAFNEVENSLAAVGNLRQQLARVSARRAVLERSLTYAEDRYRAGYSSYLESLDAQRNLFNTELAAVQLRESQLNALIRLYQVLGGGWQASREPPQPG
mgnify:CR=1 FL=1